METHDIPPLGMTGSPGWKKQVALSSLSSQLADFSWNTVLSSWHCVLREMRTNQSVFERGDLNVRVCQTVSHEGQARAGVC